MSGSPPPDPPADPPQLAGRRRKRSHTPPPATAAATTTTAVIPAPTVRRVSPPSPFEQSGPRHVPQARGGEVMADVAVQSPPYAPAYPPSAPYASTGSLPSASPSVSDSRYASGPISPRATRKPKAHVASACINCKKKHLRCDNTRPCRRCVQSGKEDTCVDVEHKKRGRPPLKPEDTSARRGFESALSPLGPPVGSVVGRGPGSDPAAYAQPQSSRPYRQLQSYGPPPMRPGQSFPPMYAQPSVQLSTGFVASGTFAQPSRVYQPGAPPPTGQPPSHYGPPPPPSEPGLRSPNQYPSGYGYQTPQGPIGPPPSQIPSFSSPLFPRPPSQPPLHGDTLPPLQSSGVQLPPIRPPSSGSVIDPSLSAPMLQQSMLPPAAVGGQQQSPRERSRSRDSGTQEPDAKRPKMDIQGILGPRSD